MATTKATGYVHSLVCEGCEGRIAGYAITGGRTYTAQQVADNSSRVFGRRLCQRCSLAAKEAQEAAKALEADEPEFTDPFAAE